MPFLFNGQLVAFVEISSKYGASAARRHYPYVE
jgi:hypothetical protein